jgi:hypothetical protein
MPPPAATPARTAVAGHPLHGWSDSAPLPLERLRSIALWSWPFALVASIALASRLRYVLGYHDNYGSGDAHLVLTRALFLERGELAPPAALGAVSNIFAHPPLIPLLLAAVAKATPLSVVDAPLVLGPIISIAGLLALYAVLCRAFDRTVAFAAMALVALLPRYSFDSTEPDKVAYVVSFFLIALFFLYEGQRRRPLLLAGGLFMGLALFAYTTALLFLPVFVASHLALSQRGLRAAIDRYFIAACAVVLCFYAAYVALDDNFGPSSNVTLPAPETTTFVPPPVGVPAPPIDNLAPVDDAGPRLVPEPVQDYWDNFRGLAERGFRDAAWDSYMDGIRDQVLDPVYVLAIAGFMLGVWLAVMRGRREIVPLLLWIAIVTVGFSMQHPAASHATRYPSYVTPAFVVLAVFFVVWAGRAVAQRLDVQPAYALALAAPLVAWAAYSYATAPDQGLRRLYEGQHDAAVYMDEHNLIGPDNRALYLGWPGFTVYLLDGGTSPDDLRTFGWNTYDLSRFDAAYLRENNIRYYLFDDKNDDYYGNGGKMLGQLARVADVREVTRFCISGGTDAGEEGCSGYAVLWELTPKPSS